MRGWIACSLLGVLGIALACTNLPDLAGNECGNRIIDPHEDCDTFGDPSIPGSGCVAPGLANACRFTCDPSGAVACPSGFFCGADSICRAPSGHLDSTPTTVGGPATFRVLAGDFDGDHAADVVTVSAAATFVHYFDGDVEASRVPISSVSVPPAIGLLGDGVTDPRASAVVITRFTTGGNVRVWRGAADRTLLPTVYGSLDLTVLSGQSALTEGRVLPAFRAGQIGSDIFALVNPDGVDFEIDAFVQADQTPQAPQVPLYLGNGPALRSASLIDGEIPIGVLRNVDGSACGSVSPFSACDNFVLAYPGDSYATVYPVCDSNLSLGHPGINVAGPNQTEPQVLSLGTDKVGGAAFLTNQGPSPAIVVVGQQAVHEFVFDCAGQLPQASIVPGITPGAETILAIGHIDELDGCLDWVGTKGIHVRYGTGCGEFFDTAAPTTWSEARIGDFNENGYPDVVAISSTAFDFYNGVGTLLLNGQHTPLDGTPKHLTVGDFDGDFAPDFAFETEPTSSASTTDDLFVSFGQVGGFPVAPQSIGELASIDQLRPAYFDYVLTGNKDFVQTLFAIEKPSTGNGHIIASLLQGGPDRLINSPFFLDPRTLQSIVQVAIGRFDGDAHADIAGVSASFTGETKIWFTPAQGDAQIDVSKVVLSAPTGIAPSAAGATAATALDVNGKPGDELAVLQPEDPSTNAKSCFFVTPIGSQPDWKAPPCEVVSNVRAPAILHAADLDGDGDADLLATWHDDQGALVVSVLFNDLSGTLSLAQATTLPALPNGDTLVAATTIHFDVGGGTQLLVLGGRGLYVAAVDPTTHAIAYENGDDAQQGAPVRAFDASDAGIDATPTSVAAADVDGDGVDDAIVGTTSGFWIYHGLPTH